MTAPTWHVKFKTLSRLLDVLFAASAGLSSLLWVAHRPRSAGLEDATFAFLSCVSGKYSGGEVPEGSRFSLADYKVGVAL
jgi:hypothetical protein